MAYIVQFKIEEWSYLPITHTVTIEDECTLRIGFDNVKGAHCHSFHDE